MSLDKREQYQHPLWFRKRDQILKRDGRCLVCGNEMRRLEVHHLCYLPGLLIWEYDDELLASVCDEHHEQLTFDMPKVAGLIAFEALKCNIDLTNLLELLKSLNNGSNTNNKTGILDSSNYRKAG